MRVTGGGVAGVAAMAAAAPAAAPAATQRYKSAAAFAQDWPSILRNRTQAMPHRRPAHHHPLALLSCLLLAACSDERRDRDAASLTIGPCEDEPLLDCGVMDAPLVRDSTDARRILVDVVRLPATGDGPHATLMVNPGGPGSSGTDLVREAAERDAFPASLRARYDIVGFDPRGVGNSDRMDCADGVRDAFEEYPRDETALQALMADTEALAERCRIAHGDRLQWLGSNAVVQDMEDLRLLLDAPSLNFIGYSYGTRLAALYLERFPASAGRIVLDGSLLPDGELLPLVIGQVEAQQRNLDRLFDACGAELPGCDRAALDAALSARLQRLFDQGELATFAVFAELVVLAISEADIGELLAPALIGFALDGDPRPLVQLAGQLGVIGDGDEGEGATGLTGDNDAVGMAVFCADDPARPTLAGLVDTLADLESRSDLFAESGAALVATCAGWPASLDPVGTIATTQAPASLVIGGTNDWQTPLAFTQPMAAAIGAASLVSAHVGHTSVFNGDSDCVDQVVLAFLLDGTLPAQANCEVDDEADDEVQP